jgi:hypothetical protein
MLAVPVNNAQQALEFKDQVVAHGLTMGEDFSWEYIPNQYDGYDDSSHTQPLVTFEFQDSKMHTFFQLRWR